MGAGPHPEAVRSRMRRLKAKHPGSTWTLVRASNGEAYLARTDNNRPTDCECAPNNPTIGYQSACWACRRDGWWTPKKASPA